MKIQRVLDVKELCPCEPVDTVWYRVVTVTHTSQVLQAFVLSFEVGVGQGPKDQVYGPLVLDR